MTYCSTGYKYEGTQRPYSLIHTSSWERSEANQKTKKCIELHKSGNGYEKRATHLKIPISTARAILKKQLELLQTYLEVDRCLLCPHAQQGG